MIALYPGAYKPPHRGHFNVVKSLLDGSYNGTIYDKDNYKEKGAELFAGEQGKKPKIDKVLVFIGAGERNGITKEESMSIWKIYSEYLTNVEILDGGSNPMFAAKDYAQGNPDLDFVSVTGIRGEEDYVDLRRVTTFKNAPNVQGLALAAKSNSGVRATDFRNKILSGNLDQIQDFFPEELSREQILGILNDLKDKIVAEMLGSNIDGFISEYFNESQLEENKVVDYIKGLGKEVYANLKAKFNKIITTAKEEGGETLQMVQLLAKQKSGTKLTSQESKLVSDQGKDLLKMTLTAAGAASAFSAVVSVLPVTATIASLISLINFLDLDDELLKYTDSSKDSSRGLTSIEKDPKNFKYLGKEKYIKYSVVEPYLDQADAVAENLSTNNERKLELKDYIASLTEYMLDKGMNIVPLPEIKVRKDHANANNFFGRTAYYDPSSKEIVLYVVGRHDKDIVRSYAHEMIHHMQNLQGVLHNINTQDTTEDAKLLELEKEAYTLGNITFRNWEDGLKNMDEGLWANINAKKKSGKKSSHKNSKAYKAAKKAGNSLEKTKK